MSFIKVAIHAVWATKDHQPFLTDEIRTKVCKHIFHNAKKNKITIDVIDGSVDHLHCLFYLNATQTVAKCLQQFKGESSKWIGDNLIKKYFGWADDYFVEAYIA
jgi:putative transposase